MYRPINTAGRVVRRKEVGIAVLVVDRWCKPGHVTVKECVYSLDIELAAVSQCPYYLQRKHTFVIVAAVYIPP